jgi:hypothetical protein
LKTEPKIGRKTDRKGFIFIILIVYQISPNPAEKFKEEISTDTIHVKNNFQVTSGTCETSEKSKAQIENFILNYKNPLRPILGQEFL